MTTVETATAQQAEIEISPDRLKAWVKLGRNQSALTSGEILAALTRAKIAVNNDVRSRVDSLLESLAKNENPPEQFLIAEGRQPVEGQDASFVWDTRIDKAGTSRNEDGSVNYYEMSNIVTIDGGSVIGEIVPAKSGEDGIDVRGVRLKPRHQPAEIQLGKGVEQSPDDPRKVISKVAGRVSYEKGVLSVIEALDIPGDVDMNTGSIDSPVDVNITGTIRDNFEVRSEKSITVGGCIDQATVLAQGDVFVRNGILGRGKGVVTSGGQCVAKFCEGAILISAGDVKIAREVMNSSVYTDGKLFVDRGSVIGGSTYAREGLEAAELGNSSGMATQIMAGTHPNALGKAKSMNDEIKEKKRVLAKIDGAIRPLMGNLKRLTPSQKEQVTELIAKAQPLRQSILETEKARDAMLAQAAPKDTPSVLVARVVHENVRIRIGQHETRSDKELKGPLRIELRKIDNLTQFVAVNQSTGSITLLPTSRMDSEAVEAEPSEKR